MVLVTVSNPSAVRYLDLVRAADGRVRHAIPRDSGKVRLYEYAFRRRGFPHSLPVPAWITDRIEELHASLYPTSPWDD